MIDLNLKLHLKPPWDEKTFRASQVGPINFLVGPNGSGKSRFAGDLLAYLRGMKENARFLGADRLSEMAWPGSLRNYWGDYFETGLAKNHFDAFRAAGTQGSGIDTIVLLEERMDLRIQIEATLGHLFDRDITLEWDSGHLIPKVGRRGRNESYRLDREECHGIKELMVLLTHLYDDRHQFLIIDEPELNLHPQYQAFFIQEVRKFSGDPFTKPEKKIVFLITHSPFILDLRSEDDFKSIISFDLKYSTPKQVAGLEDIDVSSTSSLIRRLNAHHKQLFFSDNPIFVEGIYDAWLVEAMMEARGVSVAGAGSSIIDAGGSAIVNQYLKLCQGLGKNAHFLYDLDSLFSGSLRSCVGQDDSIKSFLASAGLGDDFGKYCGKLEQELGRLIKLLRDSSVPPRLAPLKVFLENLGEGQWKSEQWAKARIAIMTAISRYRKDVVSVVSPQAVDDIEGRLNQVLTALKAINIHVLPGGTMERYLPHYQGDEYKLATDGKRDSVYAELEEMSNIKTEAALAERYGELYSQICELPSKTEVDINTVLRNHLSSYIHELQRAVVNNASWQSDRMMHHMNLPQLSRNGVFRMQHFEIKPNGGFTATISIAEMLGQNERLVRVSENTNAGMGEFEIEFASTVMEDTP